MAVYRPLSFAEFSGQSAVVRNLKVAVISATKRDAAVPHTLLSGPPGLGKTTLARIVGAERGADVVELNATSLEKPKDLVPALSAAKPNDVVFIDEIHAMRREVEEYLYSAMEDGKIHITIGEGESASTVPVTLSPFTLVGATTREGLLSQPLHDRFQLIEKLDLYSDEDMQDIITWSIEKIVDDGVFSFADVDWTKRYLVPFCHGTARLVQHILGKAGDTALVDHDLTEVSPEVIERAIGDMGYSKNGLITRQTDLLRRLQDGKPRGLGFLAEALYEEVHTVETLLEPWLIRQGYLERTPRGRMITDAGLRALENA